MNLAAFDKFSAAYLAGLTAAVEANREEYTYPVESVPTVVNRMLAAIATHPNGVNYGGSGFRRACKLLGINPTRKAIFAYLEIT